jgi:hypothetical protein
LEVLAADESDPVFKGQLLGQADAYRKIAAKGRRNTASRHQASLNQVAEAVIRLVRPADRRKSWATAVTIWARANSFASRTLFGIAHSPNRSTVGWLRTRRLADPLFPKDWKRTHHGLALSQGGPIGDGEHFLHYGPAKALATSAPIAAEGRYPPPGSEDGP